MEYSSIPLIKSNFTTALDLNGDAKDILDLTYF